MRGLFVLSIAVFFGILQFVKCDYSYNGQPWSYKGPTGPSNWCNIAPACCGKNQSPINLPNPPTSTLNASNLVFNGYSSAPSAMSLTNSPDWPTVEVTIHGSSQPILSGGQLNGTYIFHSLHFHWGSNSSVGSEHYEMAFYPMELHFVHLKPEFNGNITAAKLSSDPQAVAVLATIIQLNTVDNPSFVPITVGLSNVQNEGQTTSIIPFALSTLLPVSAAAFYSYHGSFMTPPCTENIQWMIFTGTRYISEHQLNLFRTLRAVYQNETFNGYNDLIEDNYRRPLQPINGRVVNLVSTPGNCLKLGNLCLG